MTVRSHLVHLIAAAALLPVGACKKSSNGPGGPGGPSGPSGSWATGDDGSMYNLRPDGTLGNGYDLGIEQDLLAITCRGLDTAFVVGEQGIMLRTFDGGDSWEAIDLNTTRTLRDVAAAAPDLVYVAGDQLLLVSRDSGDSFTEVAAPAQDWIQVVTDHTGAVAMALTAEGAVWRWTGGGTPQQVMSLPGAASLSLSHGGAFAALAGARGLLARSPDGGLTWSMVDSGVTVDLHAAWITEAGDLVAVGDAGTIVRAASGGVQVQTPGAGALRAVHINGQGEGLAAGEGGRVLHTGDAGITWQPLDVLLPTTVRGLDEVNGDGHL
ncbi:MAG TPA: YCF48-related protein [Kofleriaceae bacterium]|nr:YCF48-related protein [Kofleriaceae bacterium]